jgi:ATP-binding cassette subfamily C protein
MKSQPPIFDFNYIRNIALEHKKQLILANFVAILAACAAVPLPLLMPLLVDEVLLEKPAGMVETVNAWFPPEWHGPVLYIGVILLFTIVLRSMALVLNVWQSRQFTLISKEMIFRMRQTLLQRLGKVAMSEYETMGSGAVSSHFVTDLDTIDRFVGTSISKVLVASLSILGTAIILLWMHWQLALFILFLNPLVIYVTMKIGKRVKELKRTENSAYEVFQGALTETLDAIQQIRTANRESHYLSRLVGLAEGVKESSSSFEWKSEAAGRFSFMVFLIGFDVFRAVSMLMVVFSGLSVGQMMAVFGYLWFMMGPVQEVLNMQYAYFGAKAALKRVNSLLSLKQEPEYPAQHNPFNQGQSGVSLQVRDLHFSYNDELEVLKGVDLNIPAGEKVAFVGASGGGKSTLVQLLLGLYQPSQGQILFNGIPVNEIGFETVRENIATVLQHPILFNGTVRSNLTMGRDVDDSALWSALAVAQLDEFVEGLDAKLDTQVGRQGVRLSGGQRQRLAIARMVLSDPQVVILDEATSALDTETEGRLHAALDAFLQGRTVLIVAHRFSAVQQADTVYVFDDGRIVERGDHQTLLSNKGVYERLYGAYQHA